MSMTALWAPPFFSAFFFGFLLLFFGFEMRYMLPPPVYYSRHYIYRTSKQNLEATTAMGHLEKEKKKLRDVTTEGW